MKTQVFVAAFILAWTPSVCCGDDKSDAKMLEGTWAPTKAELNGNPLQEEILKDLRLVIKGDKYTVKWGEVVDEGQLKIDSAKTPKSMDVIGTEGPNKGNTIPAIYEVKDDTLRICYTLGGKERPKEFQSKKDTEIFLVSYKREKR